MCFMLGNDFMPHFPSVNIRTDGIYYLIEKYRGLFKNSDCLYDGEKIHWKNVRTLLQEIALEERDLLIQEHKNRVKAEKKHYPTNNDEEKYLQNTAKWKNTSTPTKPIGKKDTTKCFLIFKSTMHDDKKFVSTMWKV